MKIQSSSVSSISVEFIKNVIAVFVIITNFLILSTYSEQIHCYECDDSEKINTLADAKGCLEEDPPVSEGTGTNKGDSVLTPCPAGCMVWQQVQNPKPRGVKGCYFQDNDECFRSAGLLPDFSSGQNEQFRCKKNSYITKDTMKDLNDCLYQIGQERSYATKSRAQLESISSNPESSEGEEVEDGGPPKQALSHSAMIPPKLIPKKPPRQKTVWTGMAPRHAHEESKAPAPAGYIHMKLCWCAGNHCNSQEFALSKFPAIKDYNANGATSRSFQTESYWKKWIVIVLTILAALN